MMSFSQPSQLQVSLAAMLALVAGMIAAPLSWRTAPGPAIAQPSAVNPRGPAAAPPQPAPSHAELAAQFRQAAHELDAPTPQLTAPDASVLAPAASTEPTAPAAATTLELTLANNPLRSPGPSIVAPQPAEEQPTETATVVPAQPEAPRLAAAEPRAFDASLPTTPQPTQAPDADPALAEPLPPPAENAPLLLTPAPAASELAQQAPLPPAAPLAEPPPAAEAAPDAPPAEQDNPPNNNQPTPAPHPGEPAVQPDPSAGAWPYPRALLESLARLSQHEAAAAEWSARVQGVLDGLSRTAEWDDPAVAGRLDTLLRLTDEAKALAPRLAEESRVELLRCGYALVRRVSIWQHAYAWAARPEPFAVGPDPAQWPQVLAEVEQRVQLQGNPADWRRFLLLDDARRLISGAGQTDAEREFLARTILFRLHSPQLDAQHLAFLSGEPWVEFARQLRLWAQAPVDLRGLLTTIEAYELKNFQAETDALAAYFDELRWSPDPAVVALADAVGSYYRNANVRVAVSAELVNRMLPKEQMLHEPVVDRIQGARVNGESQTLNRLRLVLLPDRYRWRMGLEAQGEVASATASSKGPATFFQDGYSQYRARKLLLIDRQGMRLYQAEAHASTNSALTEFETDYDDIPLLGSIARSIAKSQYDAAQPAAKAEVEGRITQRATTQLDRAVAERMEQARRDFQAKLLDPLRKLKVDPTPLEFETTRERLITRYRLAGRDQVAAHTPRPQAPGDSLLSVQLHETALNNLIYHLNLAGRKIELKELYREVTTVFLSEAKTPPEDIPENVFVTFEDEDAVRIDCEDGRVTLLIRIRELEHNGKKWKNFAVRAHYAPSSDQLAANLVRDGVVELLGVRRAGDQITLRAIFGRVLSRNRKLNLINEQLAHAPELQDQQVTQFAIYDGWIGVALGPKLTNRQALGAPQRPFAAETAGPATADPPQGSARR